MSAVLWLRRDLRRRDLPALGAAAEAGAGSVLPLVVLDPALLASAGPARLSGLREAIDAARDSYDGALVVRHGRPEEVVPAVAREVGASSVHVSADTAPYGRARDERVGGVLREAGVAFVATGSPYAVTPGRVRNGQGGPYRVFTPFSRAWRAHGWRAPAAEPAAVRWVRAESEGLGEPLASAAAPAGADPIGEAAALARWRDFLDAGLEDYADGRDRADLDGTSRLSAQLKHGTVHPRTLLAELAAHPAGRGPGAERFTAELAWREFYADVLWHDPASAWRDWRPLALPYADPADPATAALVEAWCTGRTGFPFVDAGMRQLLATGWMHNRVRMVTASFLVKDLHVWWPLGARHFLDHLRDGDVASNSHGWQWVAGTGTDASPYIRVFNPVTQGLRFDPDGAYVRRWVPELAHLPGKRAHEPWDAPDGYAHGYPRRIVDHALERAEALARFAALPR